MYFSSKKIFIWLLAFIVSPINAPGQTVAGQYFKKIRFERPISSDDVFPGIVESILQDKKGFMWFGTKDGLIRFDGYTYKIYRNNSQDSSSLSNNIVTDILEDHDENIWVGTIEGLNRYNYKSDNFTRFQKDSTSNCLGSNFVCSLTERKDSTLWIATYYGGISILDLKTYRFTQIKANNNKNNLSTNDLRSLIFDSKEILWVATRGNGIDRYDLKTKVWEHFRNNTKGSNCIPHNDVRVIFEDSKGYIWIGSHGGGLARFDKNTNTCKLYKHTAQDNTSIGSNVIWKIYEDSNHNLWFCTQDGGLSLYIRQSDNFFNYSHDHTNLFSLPTNIIRTIYEDRAGNMWIGNFMEGISFIDKNRKEFNQISNNPFDKNSLSHNHIFSIYKDSKGILWIGTDGGGLNRYDQRKNEFKLLRHNINDPFSISNDKPSCITEDKKGNLWIGIYDGGLNYLNTKTFKVKRYFKNKAKGDVLYTVWSLKIDGDKLWVGTNKGLHLIDTRTDKIKSYPYGVRNHEGTNNDDTWCIYKDSKNRILIGTTLGLNVFYPEKGYFEYYTHQTNNKNSLSKDWVTCIYEDSQNRIWLGTNGGGLNYWDEKNNKFLVFNTSFGIASDVIHGILEDNIQNLWISSNNGLMKFNYNKNLIQRYDVNDGIQSNQFSMLAYHSDQQGYMYFGGIKGVTWFYPDSIKDNLYAPPIVFTDFRLFNQPVKILPKGSPLTENVSIAKSIYLKHNQSVFSISFSALNYSASQRNHYKYKLEGFDKNWIDSGTEHSVTYTNLNPGSYTFKVIGSNNDNVWNKTGVSLKIYVKPPFYRTWWFQSALLILIVSAAPIYYVNRVKRLHTRNAELELYVDERTKELSKANEELIEKNKWILSQNEEISAQNQEIFSKNEEISTQKDLLEEQKSKIEAAYEELSKYKTQLENVVEERTKELIIAKEKAEESDSLKTSFLANLSHEIRTPLNAIIGFSDMLADTDITEEERNNFKQIVQRSSDTFLNMINDIIDFSKIESGHLQINLLETSLFKIVTHVDDIFRLELKKQQSGITKQLEFKVKVPEEMLSLVLYTDEIRLMQVIGNLINNAIKFTTLGYIEFGCKSFGDGEMVEFYVKDTGIGIKKENLGVIFQRFRKIEDDKNKLFRGAGLGLSISAELVNLLGGQVFADSIYGQGSVFSFTIPLKKGVIDTTASLSYHIKTHLPDLENVHILVAEDDMANFMYIEKLLRNTKAKVLRAINGIQAVEMTKSIDNLKLILMDIKMPEMDGIEALKEIRKFKPELPVIAQTAHALADEVLILQKSGFDKYITKPINANELYRMLYPFENKHIT